MKKFLFYIVLIQSTVLLGQHLVVESGSLFIGENTTVSLNQTSLVANGSVSAADSSTLFVSDNANVQTLSGTSTIQLSNLKIDANCELNTLLDISENIIFNSGILNFNNSDIELKGNLIGENSSARAFTTGSGRIYTTVNIKSGQTINPGNLGLEVTPSAEYSGVKFSRGHEIQVDGNNTSIYRYYTLPGFNESTQLIFTYFGPELNDLNENNLKLFGEKNGLWSVITGSEMDNSNNKVSVVIAQSYTKISLFESSEDETAVAIPNGFSPNNDGENDFFVIKGLGNYPNNKLSVFNQWGDVLYEVEPYDNSWSGENNTGKGTNQGTKLTDGTYFYLFFKDKNDYKSVLKGFIEIKGGEN